MVHNLLQLCLLCTLITTFWNYQIFNVSLQQAVLIRQLQDQHYQQYMQQVYQQQLVLQQQEQHMSQLQQQEQLQQQMQPEQQEEQQQPDDTVDQVQYCTVLKEAWQDLGFLWLRLKLNISVKTLKYIRADMPVLHMVTYSTVLSQ